MGKSAYGNLGQRHDDGEVDDDDGDDDDDNSDAPILGCDNLEQDVEVEDSINNFG